MKSRCRWNHALSEYFKVTSGVKQGGVLSPKIFTLYVDELISRLRKSGVGCHLTSIFLAAIMYADDLCLMAPTRSALQELLFICEEFSTDFCLSFNSKKSKALLFGKPKQSVHALFLNGESIEYVETWKYLGCSIVAGPRLTFSVKAELGAFYCASNSILKSVTRPNELVLMNLLYSHCVPNLTYCAEVKEFSSSCLSKCNVALNDSIRYIFSYNRWESTRYLRQQLNLPNIVEIFHSRRRCFMKRNSESESSIIGFITDHLSKVT